MVDELNFDEWAARPERQSRTEYLPGSEKYYVTVSEFDYAGRADVRAAFVMGPGEVEIAMMRAGVTDFCLPSKELDAEGKRVDRTFSTMRRNDKFYRDLPDVTGLWILGLVDQLNHVFEQAPLSDEEREEAQAAIDEQRQELAELQEVEEELEEDDEAGEAGELPNCGGSPGEPSAAETPTTCDGSTPGRPPA